MRKSKLFFNTIVILTLVLAALGNSTMVAQAGNGNGEPKADPMLLQMAAENPNTVFMVIVQREVKNKNAQEDDPEAEVKKGGGKVKKQFKMVESFSAELTGKKILKLAKKKKVRWISVDAPMVSTTAGIPLPASTVTPSPYTSVVHADQLWDTLTGQGVTVAVIDSGVTTSHPDFITDGSSRVIASEKFGNYPTTEDLYGHGTHVAGIIGGSGYASGGTYKGVAPDVNLINLKTSNEFGMNLESDVLNALQWVYTNKDAYNIRIVNISLNSTVAQSYHTSPLCAAVEILWFNGVVVLVSAGNNGTADGPSTVYPPANDPFVITVGAMEDKGTADLTDDTMAVFSAYAPAQSDSLDVAKPDLVAPGRNVVAPLGGLNNIAYVEHPLNRVNDYYFRMSGTSMATPVVSGAVALLLQDEPNLNPDQVKYRLMATATQNWPGYNSVQSGAGNLDIYSAVNSSTDGYANQGIMPSLLLSTGSEPITWDTVGWNTVGWNTVGWNTVGWNTVGWNTVGWNTVGWNTSIWDN